MLALLSRNDHASLSESTLEDALVHCPLTSYPIRGSLAAAGGVSHSQFTTIRDFKREKISEHSTLTVVARRRRILHSAITALNKGYFDWHKCPQIEFVGEMADYGSPTREFFRLKNAKLRRHGKIFRTVLVTGLQIVVCQGYMKPKSMTFLRYFPKL
ncbi:hypothetical protein MHYP_G00234670 [Metynnis hypsauchen]